MIVGEIEISLFGDHIAELTGEGTVIVRFQILEEGTNTVSFYGVEIDKNIEHAVNSFPRYSG